MPRKKAIKRANITKLRKLKIDKAKPVDVRKAVASGGLRVDRATPAFIREIAKRRSKKKVFKPSGRYSDGIGVGP